MSLYDILLDNLLTKRKLDREQIDETVTQAANVLGVSKWYVIHAYGQALCAYGEFKDSMQKLINEPGMTSKHIGEVSDAIRHMADEI